MTNDGRNVVHKQRSFAALKLTTLEWLLQGLPGAPARLSPRSPPAPPLTLHWFPSPPPHRAAWGSLPKGTPCTQVFIFRLCFLEGTQIQTTSRSSLPADRHRAFLLATLPPHALPRQGHRSCSVFPPGSPPAHVTS